MANLRVRRPEIPAVRRGCVAGALAVRTGGIAWRRCKPHAERTAGLAAGSVSADSGRRAVRELLGPRWTPTQEDR